MKNDFRGKLLLLFLLFRSELLSFSFLKDVERHEQPKWAWALVALRVERIIGVENKGQLEL
jgi:hypothetical protein